jgi:hypothetical protein
MNKLFRKIGLFFKNLFSKEDREHIDCVGEYTLNGNLKPEKKYEITTYFIDKEKDPTYLSLKKAVDSLGVKTLTDLIDFFNSVYENRLSPDWCEKVINKTKEEINTYGKLRNEIFYKAIRAFFGCFGCYVKIGPSYYYGSPLPEMVEGNDWETVVDWTISKMTFRWLEFIACPTQSDAMALIFRFNDGDIQIKEEN